MNQVMTSFYPIEYVVSQIAGDETEVKCLIPHGSEPHDYELTPRQVASIYDSKALFLCGRSMENFQESLPDSIAQKTYALSSIIEDENSDPHIWLSTANLLEMASFAKGKLSDIYPKSEPYFSANLASFAADIAILKEYGSSLSLSGKHVLISHDAFSYMAEEFGFIPHYVNGLSPSDEPSPKAIAEILSLIKEYRMDTIFYAELESDDIATYLAKKTGLRVETLSPLETIGEGEDFLDIYKEDLLKISQAKSL